MHGRKSEAKNKHSFTPPKTKAMASSLKKPLAVVKTQ
jgi:hypothetical protein